MAKYFIEDTTLKDIADAIRAKEESSAAIPVADFATRISDIQTGVDTSADTVVADALTEGYTAHDAAGNLVNGANPYAKEETNTTVNTQADLIAQIQTALEGKAAGGGVSVETCTLQIGGTMALFNFCYCFISSDGEISYSKEDSVMPGQTFNVLCDSIVAFNLNNSYNQQIFEKTLQLSNYSLARTFAVTAKQGEIATIGFYGSGGS